MEHISKLLNLSDDAVAIYFGCLGEIPLTYNEIHSLKPELSHDELKKIINLLIERDLLKKYKPESSDVLTHYTAIPPFFVINNSIAQIKKDFKELQQNIEKDISSKPQTKEDTEVSKDFLEKFENELKNLISSELASIVILILQLKNEILENPNLKAAGITFMQWDAIKNTIKDILAQSTHTKAQELNKIVSEEFNEIREILKSKSSSDISRKEISSFQNLTEDISANMQFIEEFLQLILTNYTGAKTFDFDNFWPVYSEAKVREETLNLLSISKKNIVIIVPELKDYIDNFILEKLKNSSFPIKIKIVSSDSHNSDIVNEITKNENVEFLRLKYNNFIGLNGDNKKIVFGVIKNVEYPIKYEENSLKKIIGFGTNHSNLINLISPVISEQLRAAKPPREVQITKGFNQIIENINTIKGNKIGKILQEILDVAFENEGISLKILDLKLLVSKLKSIDAPLQDDLKASVIENIKVLNEQLSNLKLSQIPEFRTISKDIEIQPEVLASERIIKEKPTINEEQMNGIFDIFLEKANDLNGTELSKQIENIIDFSLKFQGFSKIVEWKNELKSNNSILEPPFLEKIRGDINNWRNSILMPKTPTLPIEPSQTAENVVKPFLQRPKVLPLPKKPSIDEKYLKSSLLTQSDQKVETTGAISSQVIGEKNITNEFHNISLKLDILSCKDISKQLQDVVDVILETKGYSMALKEIRQWISKLRSIRGPLEEDLKISFLEELEKWKIKFNE